MSIGNNPFIVAMPRMVDLGARKDGAWIYINVSSISHIIDKDNTLQVFMYTSPVDRYGHIQPLTLTGQQRINLLEFVETLEAEENAAEGTVGPEQEPLT